MARGWESKAVESQVEDKRIERERRDERPEAAEAAREQKRHSLELSRRRVTHELSTATSPVHRTALENALKFLDDELERLGKA